MLYVLPETTGDIIVLQANSVLTTADYNDVFLPLFEHVKNTHPEVRLLITFAPDCEGFEEGSIWEANHFGNQHSADYYRVAVVGHEQWQTWLTQVQALLTQGDIRHYRMTQLLEALRWINDEGEEDEEETFFPFQ